MRTFLCLLPIILFTACTPKQTAQNPPDFSAYLDPLSEAKYPHNPDRSIQSDLSGRFAHDSILFYRAPSGTFRIVMPPANAASDSLILSNIDLAEWIPTIPDSLKTDDYLEQIGLINQEWNRQQVSFTKGHFESAGGGNEHQIVSRIDLARNCLNACLWEVIAYTEEGGETKPYYHGWFSFPKAEYKKLFEERNNIAYDKWGKYLDEWEDPESKIIDLQKIRTVESEKTVAIQNKNEGFYPVVGERKKKAMNIIIPAHATRINDFLTDSTQFATFSPPGIYDRDEPRETELSLLYNPVKAIARTVRSNGQTTNEIEIRFARRGVPGTITRFIVGGIDIASLPAQTFENTDKGWQMPMGIADHTFYESYGNANENAAKRSPFYAFLLNKEGYWLDSHAVGIDGPLLYRDAVNPRLLHFWILSFERHAFVGHYVLEV